ncbi:hypothetical protein [Veronia pacifica]|nr:hypothetical protein [Veronia pacifica]
MKISNTKAVSSEFTVSSNEETFKRFNDWMIMRNDENITSADIASDLLSSSHLEELNHFSNL